MSFSPFSPEDLQPLVITNATLLSFSQSVDYFGGDIGFKKTKQIKITCSSSDISNQHGVSTESKDLFELLKNKRDYSSLTINGKEFGNAKIVSFSTEAEDMVNSLSCSIDFLIHESFGDLSTLTGYYADYGNANIEGSIINSFSDSIQLQSGENSSSYDRSISIQANNSLNIENLTDVVKGYVKDILDYSVFSFPDLTAFQEDIHDLTSRSFKKLVTETIDEIALSFSFRESLNVGNVVGDYSLVNTQTLTTDSNGIVTVSEQGEIQGLTEPRIDAAEAGYATQIAASKTRLSDMFTQHALGSCRDLNTDSGGSIILFTKGKTIDTFQGNISYNVSANNDPKYESDSATWEYTIVSNFDGTHTNATEQGSIEGLGNLIYDKDGGSNLDVYPKYIKAKDVFEQTVLPGDGGVLQNIDDRIKDLVPDSCPKPISRSETHSPRKGVISYSRSFSNNPIYAENDGIAKKIESSTAFKDALPNVATYVSLNPENSREIVQKLNTLSNVQISNSVNILGYRINFNDEYSKMIEMGNLAKSKVSLLDLSSAIKYLESCSYNYKGANDVQFSLSTSHVGGEDSCQP